MTEIKDPENTTIMTPMSSEKPVFAMLAHGKKHVVRMGTLALLVGCSESPESEWPWGDGGTDATLPSDADPDQRDTGSDAEASAPDAADASDVEAASDAEAASDVDVVPPIVDPVALSERVLLGDGADPDVAVDSTGTLHLAYVRGGTTYYRKVDDPSGIGPEIAIGPGADPQIGVDSQDRPHVVMGAVAYARWDGTGFTAPTTLTSAWRKPRIALDAADRVYVTVSRNEHPRVILFVLDNGAVLAGPTAVGQDNNGSISIDSTGLAHIVWRDFNVSYSTYDLDAGASPGLALHPSSDFSWCAVDKRDDSVHVVNTIRLGGGITYRYLRDGAWSQPEDHAVAEVSGVDDADHVGPTIDIDSDGFKYVAFAGRDRIPYYLVIDPDGQSLGVTPLDAAGGSVSGGKYENPNVGAGKGRRGSFVAWGATQVFVRGIGLAN